MIRFIKYIIRIIIFCILLLLLFYFLAFLSGDCKDNSNHYIRIYDEQNDLFYESLPTHQGDYVSIDKVSPYFLQAIVSIEDHRFYKHQGFDYLGIIRAMKVNVENQRIVQGASTISQQYARLKYLNNEKSWLRKIKEVFYTMKLETHLSKDEILEGYINNVYFGHGIYGIKDAAKYFYNKEPDKLSLNEACMLAGIVNGPQYFSPLINSSRAMQRRNTVLQAMKDHGYIDIKSYNDVFKSSFNLSNIHQLKSNPSIQYYVDYILDELKYLGYDSQYYIDRGLNIYTSFSKEYQNELQSLILKHDSQTDMQCAFTISNPRTHQIQAIIGGKDYNLSPYNRAMNASRQIGSTMKPILYYLALEHGFDPSTKFESSPTSFKLDDGTVYSPSNYNKRYAYKDITLAQAIAVSDNIYAMKTHLFLGSDTLSSFLNDFGFHVENHASLALGTMQTNILKLADLYHALAYKGRYQPSYGIIKIVDDTGKIVYRHQDKIEARLDETSCLILSQLLTGTFHKEFSTYLHATMENYPLDHIACKTGSTDYDKLIVAYNKDIVFMGWSGYDDNSRIELSKDKSFVKKVAYDFLKNKKRYWYRLENVDVKKIDINGNIQDNGLTYYYRKE